MVYRSHRQWSLCYHQINIPEDFVLLSILIRKTPEVIILLAYRIVLQQPITSTDTNVNTREETHYQLNHKQQEVKGWRRRGKGSEFTGTTNVEKGKSCAASSLQRKPKELSPTWHNLWISPVLPGQLRFISANGCSGECAIFQRRDVCRGLQNLAIWIAIVRYKAYILYPETKRQIDFIPSKCRPPSQFFWFPSFSSR